jgi:hypothetical protein
MNPEMLIEYPDRGPDSGSAAPLSCWSDGERELFYELIRWYPKDFFKIASHITDKSTKDCVYFFYHTDKKVIAIQGTSIPRITRASRKKAVEKGIVDNTSPPAAAAARESEVNVFGSAINDVTILGIRISGLSKTCLSCCSFKHD